MSGLAKEVGPHRSKLSKPFVRQRRKGTGWALLALQVGLAFGCSGDKGSKSNENKTAADERITLSDQATLIFPTKLHAKDVSVNEFVKEAMRIATSDDYDAFRLLWASDEEPFDRGQFEKGWKSVRTLQIGVLQKMRLGPDGEAFYAVFAEAYLDAEKLPQGVEPYRSMVLIIKKEHDQWRLGHSTPIVKKAVSELMAGHVFPTDKTASTR